MIPLFNLPRLALPYLNVPRYNLIIQCFLPQSADKALVILETLQNLLFMRLFGVKNPQADLFFGLFQIGNFLKIDFRFLLHEFDLSWVIS